MSTPYCENPGEPLRIQKVEDYRIAPHLHTAAEIIFVEKGEVALTVGSLDYNLSQGDYAFILPNTLHSVAPSRDGTAVYVIDCKQEVISDVVRRLAGLRPASPVLRAMEVPELLSYALAAITVERDKYVSYSIANLMASVMVSKLRFAEIHDSVTSDLTNRILTYLGIHFREQISLDQLAEVMNVSRFHLSHLFSGKLGIGFKEYLNNLRIECAKTMLRSTDTPISVISTEVGFDNQRTFNRVFRDVTGASPRDYRLRREDYTKVPPEIQPLDPEAIESINVARAQNAVIENDITPVSEPSEAPAEPKKPRRKRAPKDTVERVTPPTVAEEETLSLPSDIDDLVKKKKKEQAWFL